MGVQPFDVLVMTRIPNLTSAGCATQLVDKCQVKRRKGWPRTDKKPSTEEKLPSWKTVH